MPRCVCYAALRKKTRVSWIKSYKLNPPKMVNILWRDKFSKDLIRMNKRDLRAATQILTGHACLNYHRSKLNRSVQPLCPLCEAEYDTVPHLLAQCPLSNALAVESRVLRHSLHHCHGHSRQIQPEKDHWLREQNKPSGVLRHWSYVSWQVEWSRNSRLLLYDLDLSSQYLRLGFFVLRSGPCLDNCWHLLASRYIWGVKGTWFHQLDFWKSIPHLVVVLWLREQNKPSGSSETL